MKIEGFVGYAVKIFNNYFYYAKYLCIKCESKYRYFNTIFHNCCITKFFSFPLTVSISCYTLFNLGPGRGRRDYLVKISNQRIIQTIKILIKQKLNIKLNQLTLGISVKFQDSPAKVWFRSSGRSILPSGSWRVSLPASSPPPPPAGITAHVQ